MAYRFLALAASLLFLGGCFMPAANPTARADTQNVVRRNLDGSTTQGVEVIANYNGRRVLTLQADPMGGALGIGSDVGRGVRSMTTPASRPHVVTQGLDYGTPPAQRVYVERVVPHAQTDCEPEARGSWQWVPAN